MTDGTRTRDTQDHNLVLYQLNYSHHRSRGTFIPCSGFQDNPPPRLNKTAGSGAFSVRFGRVPSARSGVRAFTSIRVRAFTSIRGAGTARVSRQAGNRPGLRARWCGRRGHRRRSRRALEKPGWGRCWRSRPGVGTVCRELVHLDTPPRLNVVKSAGR